MQMVGLFTLHQNQKRVLELLEKNGELFVHFRGRVLYKIVPLTKNTVADATLPTTTKLVNSGIPKTHNSNWAEAEGESDPDMQRQVDEKMRALGK